MNKTDILIVVDVQNGFVNSKSEDALPGIRNAIKHARSLGIPIFFTRFINERGSSWESLIGWNRLQSSPEIDLHPAVASSARPEEIVDKTTYTSLVGPIEQAVAGAPVTVALCGIATDGCVLKTAVDLFEMGARPVVLTDAVASHAGDEIHEAGLQLMRRFIGRDQLTTTDEWFSASHPATRSTA